MITTQVAAEHDREAQRHGLLRPGATRRLLQALVAAIVVGMLFGVLGPGDAAPTGSVVLALSSAACVLISPTVAAPITAVWSMVAVGWAVQLRLGAVAGDGAKYVIAAAAVFIVGVWFVRRFGTRQVPRPRSAVMFAAITLGMAFGLRLLPAVFDDLQSGKVPLFGTSVQIGEFTRILVLVGFGTLSWFAAEAVGRGHVVRADRRLVAIAVSLVIANLALLAAVDTGPAVVLGAAMIFMLGLAFRPLRPILRRARFWLILTALVGGGLLVAANLSFTARLAQRWENVSSPDFQLTLGLQAAQQGGIVGSGLGSSNLADHVPVAGSDFLPAVVAADFGLLPAAVLVCILLVAFGSLYTRIVRGHGALAIAAAGVCVALITQTVMTILGPLGAVPLTGLSMPALAVTGSTLLSTMIALAVVCGGIEGEFGANVAAAPRARPPRFVLAICAGILVYCMALALLPTDRTAGALFMPRGDLLTADGMVIATTDARGARVYPAGSLYSDIGYFRPDYAGYGLESTAENTLTCGGPPTVVDVALQVFHPMPCHSISVSTTIRSDLQRTVQATVAGLNAEVVVSDSATGDVLSLYSGTQPDPATFVDGQSPAAPTRLKSSAPGSTFKLIVAAAALLDDKSSSGAPLTVLTTADGELHNSEGFTCDDDSIATMLAQSCNTVSGYLGVGLGQTEIGRVASTYFGADAPFTFDGGDVQALSTGTSAAVPLSDAQLARTAIGQESVRSSPLALNAATAVIAASGQRESGNENSGIPALHIIAGTCAAGASTPNAGAGPVPSTFGRLLPPAAAAVLLDGMHGATRWGTAALLGATAAPLGLDIAAKTGTAEVDPSTSSTGTDSWVTAIIEGHLVMTVLVHNADPAGANPAVGITAQVLPAIAAYLGSDQSSQCQERSQ